MPGPIERKLNIAFMGTPEFAVPSLKALLDREDEVVAVITNPDRPKGRGQRPTPPPVKVLAEKAGVPVWQPAKVKTDDFLDQLKDLAPDLIIIVAYGKILPLAVLNIPPLGCINVHASLLPQYRGGAPINWAIANGEGLTGITTMFINEKMDEGDMLLKREEPISDDDTAGSLHDRLSPLGGEVLRETLNALKAGTLQPQKQNHEEATYAPLLKKEDGLIDWSRPARELYNFIRGMNPWPAAYTGLEQKNLRVFASKIIDNPASASPGTVIDLLPEGMAIATGQDGLLLTEVQLEDRKRMPAGEFLRGHPLSPGKVLG